MKKVLITISNSPTGADYLARSYPDDDYNNNGKTEFYKVAVYKVIIENIVLVNKERYGQHFVSCLIGMTLQILVNITKQKDG